MTPLLTFIRRPKLVGIKPKIEKRERRREQKAEIAAKLEHSIEKQLLERLEKGVYGDIYNFNQKAFEQVLSKQDVEEDEDDEEDDEEEEEDDLMVRSSTGLAQSLIRSTNMCRTVNSSSWRVMRSSCPI